MCEYSVTFHRSLESLVYLPVPDIDHHVVLVAHTDDVFSVGRKRHTGNSIFMFLQLGHLQALRHVPDPHRRHVAALTEEEEEEEEDQMYMSFL